MMPLSTRARRGGICSITGMPVSSRCTDHTPPSTISNGESGISSGCSTAATSRPLIAWMISAKARRSTGRPPNHGAHTCATSAAIVSCTKNTTPTQPSRASMRGQSPGVWNGDGSSYRCWPSITVAMASSTSGSSCSRYRRQSGVSSWSMARHAAEGDMNSASNRRNGFIVRRVS